MKAVYKNELSTYFTTLTGYVFCAFLLLFAGIYTTMICLKNQFVEFEYVLGNLGFVFFIIVPVLTMRVFAEERRQKTDQLLYSLPISTTEVVLGKYFALLTVLVLPLLVICLYPLVLSLYGGLNLMGCYLAILAFFFMGAAFLAIGMFISSITESQALAAGLCFVLLLVNYFLTTITKYITSKAVISFIGILIAAAIVALILYLMTKNFYISVGMLIIALSCSLIGILPPPWGLIFSLLCLFLLLWKFAGAKVFPDCVVVVLLSWGIGSSGKHLLIYLARYLTQHMK